MTNTQKKSLSERFQGKEFWRTLNLTLIFIMYGVFIVVPIFFPDQIFTVVIIAVFILLAYFAIQQSVYRKMEQKNAGRRVLTGWIDEEEELGEEYEIPIKKIYSFDRLSASDQDAVDDFIQLEKERIGRLKFREDRLGLLINQSTKEDKKSVKG